MKRNSVKTAFWLELKALFGSMRAYIYIFVMLASTVGFTAFFNFYGGISSIAASMRYLALPIMLALPAITAGAFAGRRNFDRMLYSLGATEHKLFFGRALAILLTAVAPMLPMLAVPPMLLSGGAAEITSSYIAVAGILLFTIAYTCALITVSAASKSLKISYWASYIFFAVQYVSNMVFPAVTCTTLPLLISCVFFAVCISLLFYGFTKNTSVALTVMSVLTVISCAISIFAEELTFSLVRTLFKFFAINTALNGFTSTMLFDPKVLIRLLLFALLACALTMLMLFKRRNTPFLPTLSSKLGKSQAFAACGALMLVIGVLMSSGINLIFGSSLADLTTENIFTPSEDTEKLIKDIDEEVTITLTVSDGSEYEDVLSMLAKYTSANKNIKVETVRDEESIYTGSLKFQSSKRSYTLSRHLMVAYSESAELYAQQTYSYYYENGQTDMTYTEFVQYYGEYFGLSDGYRYEGCINKMLEYVTSDEVKTVLLASGLPSEYFGDGLLFLFAANMVELNGVTLKDTVPEADAVILMPVETDISEADRKVLSSYLNGGGRVILMSSYGTDTYTNLTALCAEYGLSSSAAYVFEDDSSFYYGSTETIMPSVSDSALAELIDGKTVMLPLCTELKTQSKDGITHKTLLTSSEKSYTKADYTKGYTFDETTDTRGVRSIAVSATNEAGGEFIYISSSLLLLDDLDVYTDGSNRDIFFALTAQTSGNASDSTDMDSKFPSSISLSVPNGLFICYALVGELIALAVLALGIFKAFKRANDDYQL